MTDRQERVWASIDLGRISANLAHLREVAGRPRVMAVLKADAYGLGVVPVAAAAANMSPPLFFGM